MWLHLHPDVNGWGLVTVVPENVKFIMLCCIMLGRIGTVSVRDHGGPYR